MTVYRSGVDRPPIPRQRPRLRALRWMVAVVAVLLLGNLLLVQAYAAGGFAPDGSQSPQDNAGVPAAIRDGGPIIDTIGSEPRSYRMPPGVIALTFDDGPDPMWTPQILDVLARHQVGATFFVVGSQVARHPDIARRLVDEGHEIGDHTFSHPDLEGLSGWRRDLEDSQTQMAIAQAAGVTTAMMRPPYSSFPNALDDAGWAMVVDAGRRGYLTVLSDTDSRDWALPGVDAIVRNATPANGAGAVVLFHDGGGDRAQTVAALDRFIPQMRQQGYQFAPVSSALGPQRTEVNPAAPATSRWRGAALVAAVQAAAVTLWALWALLLVVGALTLARTLLMFFFAVAHARRRRAAGWSWGPPVADPVSVIVPAYNEQASIGAAVRSLALSAHRDVEVIVVDDASTDDTASVVESLGLGNVRVARVPHGGKGTALNAGIGLARHDLIVMVDADTVVDVDSIHRLVQPFADPTVGAVAGNVKVGNRQGILGRWQHIEYVIGFNLDRRLYDVLGCMPTVPGALGAFRRSALTAAGGLSLDTIAEDTDLTIAIHRAGWRVVYEETARSYTEAPATVSELWKQRYRWSYGTMQALWKHRRAVFDHGPSGRFGRRGLPFLALFTVLLPVLAPLLDLFAIYGTVFLNRWETLAGWFAVLVVQTVTAVLAFRLDSEPLRPLWALPLQQFVYRQIMYLVLLESVAAALTGRRLHWQHMHHAGEVRPVTS
jgi:cellulose synthase/poly-beta-1,6-N-acetylglucosamine synthase-like glycosyltransferase/peptidoglycan/xylan/chitin deacetylase (PgdA/CDA1 family)